MQEKKKNCKNCGNYRAYYEKIFWNFEKKKFGNCCRCKKTVTEDEGEECAFWQKNRITRQIRREIILKKVALVAEEFFPLKQILEEEIEENKIDPLR